MLYYCHMLEVQLLGTGYVYTIASTGRKQGTRDVALQESMSSLAHVFIRTLIWYTNILKK